MNDKDKEIPMRFRCHICKENRATSIEWGVRYCDDCKGEKKKKKENNNNNSESTGFFSVKKTKNKTTVKSNGNTFIGGFINFGSATVDGEKVKKWWE